MKGICELSVIPMRAVASDRSEMVNQLIMGETYDVMEIQEKWMKIKLHHDHYEGWIDKKQFHPMLSENTTSKTPLPYPEIRSNQFFPAGCFLENLSNSKKWNSIEDCAKSFLLTPYLWGGRTHAGIDCSGFTQMVYRLMGFNIPRDASQQINMEGAQLLNFVSEARPGDLAYFENSEGKIIHVGMILSVYDQFAEIIHASGEVRIDQLDQQGIKRDGQYSHHLRALQQLPKLHITTKEKGD